MLPTQLILDSLCGVPRRSRRERLRQRLLEVRRNRSRWIAEVLGFRDYPFYELESRDVLNFDELYP